MCDAMRCDAESTHRVLQPVLWALLDRIDSRSAKYVVRTSGGLHKSDGGR